MAAPPPSLNHPLENRVAIVTGGSRGIGKAISLHLSSLGAKLLINFNSDSAQADHLAAQLNADHPTPRAVTFRADVSEPAQVKSMFEFAEAEFKAPVNILVNSAGVLDSKYPGINNTEVEDFDYVMKVNVRGAFLCCKEASNRIKRGGEFCFFTPFGFTCHYKSRSYRIRFLVVVVEGGRIICLSTSMVAALRPGYGAYAASKAAVEAMIKILAKELKGTRITANCVAPGPIATEMFYAGKTEEMIKSLVDACPLGRLGQTEDVAPLVGFLACDSGEWINGQIVRANGGYV
ncbi:hypothetical protein Leryth_001231 [Lithospermum erythrorhizon]|nr:hypothetical protein Leryth_001231 [Lithospermum erythrorhizon]